MQPTHGIQPGALWLLALDTAACRLLEGDWVDHLQARWLPHPSVMQNHQARVVRGQCIRSRSQSLLFPNLEEVDFQEAQIAVKWSRA